MKANLNRFIDVNGANRLVLVAKPEGITDAFALRAWLEQLGLTLNSRDHFHTPISVTFKIAPYGDVDSIDFCVSLDAPVDYSGVSLNSCAHPRAPWWRRLAFWRRRLSAHALESLVIDVQEPPLAREDCLYARDRHGRLAPRPWWSVRWPFIAAYLLAMILLYVVCP